MKIYTFWVYDATSGFTSLTIMREIVQSFFIVLKAKRFNFHNNPQVQFLSRKQYIFGDQLTVSLTVFYLPTSSVPLLEKWTHDEA